MPPLIPLNPDLPSSYQIPGIYGYISLLGAGPTPLNRRVNLLGYRTSTGTAAAGTPIRVNNEDDVVLYCGKGSDLHRMYRAFQSQGAVGAEVWVTPMTAPSGTVQTRLIKVMAMPSTDGAYGSSFGAVLDTQSKTGALAAGIWTLWICGYRCDCIIANGDTYATIATNMVAEINKVVDFLPYTAANSGTQTITLTARHAALTAADCPIVSTFTNQTAMYLAASPGTLTLANASHAVNTGSIILYCATQSATSAIAANTAVNTLAATLVSSINSANNFPLAAAQAAATAIATLFYQNDRVVNWLAAAITPAATITTTLAAAWGNEAAGLPSSSTPALSQVLTNIKGVSDSGGAFRHWITNFTGAGSYITDATYTQTGSATEYAVMGTISTHIEAEGNGRVCKGQRVFLADSRALATAGAIPTGTSPALTASPRYRLLYVPACPQQALEMAARACAIVVGEDFLPRNYAGKLLTTDSKVPLLGIHPAVAMTDSDANSAMLTYYMTPVRMDTQGRYTIVSGRTTAKPGSSIDVRFVFWGTIDVVDYFRDDLRSYLGGLLQGKSIKAYSQPVSTNCVTPDAVRDLCFGRALTWDGLDYYDGAARLKDYFAAGINSFVPSRIDVAVPLAEPVPLEQVSLYFMQVA